MKFERRVPRLGVWPFDSEKDNNLDQAVAAAAQAVRAKVQPQLSVLQESTWFLVDLYRDPWEQFIRDYMAVAKVLGRPYTSNADYYSLWEPRLKGYGWDKGILEKLMAALRQLGASGVIPPEVMDPAHIEAPGSDGLPWLDDIKDLVGKGLLVGGLILGGVILAKNAGSGKK